jgi:hypothetical protein
LRKGTSERRNYPRWLLDQLRILLREQTACASFPNRGKILRDSLDAKEFCIVKKIARIWKVVWYR